MSPSSGCALLGCPREVVATLDWGGIVLSFCIVHVEDKPGEPGVQVVWLSERLTVCRRCGRPVPTANLAEHFTARGAPCRQADAAR